MVMDSPGVAPLSGVLTIPEIVRFVRMAYAFADFDVLRAVRVFPTLKYRKPATVEGCLQTLREDVALREQVLKNKKGEE